MSSFFDRYDAVFFLGFVVYEIVAGLIGVTVNYRLGIWLIFGPVIFGLSVLALSMIVRDAYQQIKAESEDEHHA